MTGFRSVINSWLYLSDQIIFLVDPGPRNSVKTLIKSLKEINVKRIGQPGGSGYPYPGGLFRGYQHPRNERIR